MNRECTPDVLGQPQVDYAPAQFPLSDFTVASLLGGFTTRFRVDASCQQYIRADVLVERRG